MTEETRDENVEQQEDTEKAGLGGFIEHQKTVWSEVGHALGALFPPEFKEHTRNAGNAFLDSFKSLFEGVKSAKDEDESAEEGDSNAERKVKVDVK